MTPSIQKKDSKISRNTIVYIKHPARISRQYLRKEKRGERGWRRGKQEGRKNGNKAK